MTEPIVSIIIPFRDKADYLERCVKSVLKTVSGLRVELLLVDNLSRKSETTIVVDALASDDRVKVLQYREKFNFSAINNFAAANAEGKFLLFLNNDTEAIAVGWLESMIEVAGNPAVGVVGAKLLYPDDSIQHVGVMLGPNLAIHPFSGFKQDDPLFMKHCARSREWAAVTAACMLTGRELFTKMGGFDENHFAIAYNDVDYCLRLGAEGLSSWVTPDATLYHYESASRGNDVVSWFTNPIRYYGFLREKRALRDRWKDMIANDSHYDASFLRK